MVNVNQLIQVFFSNIILNKMCASLVNLSFNLFRSEIRILCAFFKFFSTIDLCGNSLSILLSISVKYIWFIFKQCFTVIYFKFKSRGNIVSIKSDDCFYFSFVVVVLVVVKLLNPTSKFLNITFCLKL